MFIQCENLVKIYQVADLEIIALQGLDLMIAEKEMVGIVGASGSGKSTFLNVLGGLSRPSAGRISVGGYDLLKMSQRELERYRLEQVGFLWQQSARNLLPYLTAEENIALPMTIAGRPFREKRAWTKELLDAVGLWEHRKHKLVQLSGGQQQRVAIGVALANRPHLLLCDEPTGELDSHTADEIMALFAELNQQYRLTIVIVTHDPQINDMVDRVITIRDGRMSSETLTASQTRHQEERIVVDHVGRLQLPRKLREQVGGRVVIEAAEDGTLRIRPTD